MGIVRIAAPMSNPTEMPFVVKALIQKKSSFFFFTGVDYTVLLVEEWWDRGDSELPIGIKPP